MENVQDKLKKLKNLFEHPTTPEHEAETAKRLYEKLLANNDLTENDLEPFEVELLRKYGVELIVYSSGERTYKIKGDNQSGVDMALHDIFTNALKRRRKVAIEEKKEKKCLKK